MLLILLAYLGGALTILSPCILPVLPFVFAGAGQPFWRNGLPLLAGMAATFALVASLAAVGGGWVVAANQYGRWLALALMALFAVALLLPSLATRLAQPLVAAGARLSEVARSDGSTRPGASFAVGVATGLLWAPCAGPILGLVLSGAALQGASLGSSLLLLAYALGAASSMAIVLLAGGKVLARLKRSLGVGEWLRRGLGATMLAGVVAIALGLDTGLLARISVASTGGIEQRLVDGLAGAPTDAVTTDGTAMAMSASPTMSPNPAMAMQAAPIGAGAGTTTSAETRPAVASLPVERAAPPLEGAVQWLNSAPLSLEELRGKVVLVDFWTYSCINCLRSLPHVKAWSERYRDQGLVVVGVHAPEFAFERSIANVERAVRDLGIDYPVAIDNDYAIWRAFANRYWPAHYFIDARGRVRYHHFGEGKYEESEQVIRQLLSEAGSGKTATAPPGKPSTAGSEGGANGDGGDGVQLAADFDTLRSPETYLGYERAEHFASAEPLLPDRAAAYSQPVRPKLNDWGLAGTWKVGAEQATLLGPSGRIVHRFHARDLHLVLGPGPDGKPVRFRVTVDGKAPGQAHGVDIAPDGSGVVTAERLYQLVRQPGPIVERSFAIEFLDPGVSAYAFTFG